MTEEFNLVVSEPIVNTSTVVSSAKVGTSVTVYGSASGTGSKQYAFYYRKPGATAWTTAQSFSYKNTVSVYLGTTFLETPLEDLELSVRSYNCLRRAGVRNVGDIVDRIDNRADLLRIRNLGAKSADEIMNAIMEYQFTILPEGARKKYLDRIAELNSREYMGKS